MAQLPVLRFLLTGLIAYTVKTLQMTQNMETFRVWCISHHFSYLFIGSLQPPTSSSNSWCCKVIGIMVPLVVFHVLWSNTFCFIFLKTWCSSILIPWQWLCLVLLALYFLLFYIFSISFLSMSCLLRTPFCLFAMIRHFSLVKLTSQPFKINFPTWFPKRPSRPQKKKLFDRNLKKAPDLTLCKLPWVSLRVWQIPRINGLHARPLFHLSLLIFHQQK